MNDTQENIEELINAACDLISDNLGTTTAEQYRKFYQGKDRETIEISIRELLIELVGPENARKQLEEKIPSIKNNKTNI